MPCIRPPASENRQGMKVKDSGIAKFRYEEQVVVSLWQGLILKTKIATDGKEAFSSQPATHFAFRGASICWHIRMCTCNVFTCVCICACAVS